MIEVFKQLFTADMNEDEKLNRMREMLQVTCLKIMHDKNFFNNLAFVGGTALRILFNLKRFSEDLDFSLIQKKGYDFSKINAELLKELKLLGLNVEANPQEERIVHSMMLKFKGLLKAVGLSPLASQKFSIKIEIDTNPPEGGNIQNSYVSKVYTFNVVHFDLPSMYATKLNACFYRKYLKGRDFYDLIWYLANKIHPNYLLFNNAFRQTQGVDLKLNEGNFKKFLLDHIEKIDFEEAKKDVFRFLEDKNELKLFELEAIKGAIETAY